MSASMTSTSLKNISTNGPVQYLVLLLLILLTLYGLSSAFTRGVANAWYFNAEFSLNDWAEHKSISDKTDYENTLASIKKAQSLDPTHPHYAHMLGRVMHWGVDQGFEPKAKLEEIKAWYIVATELRPLWPDPWADLVRLNNYLNGYTDETRHYIQQALITGPYIDLVRVATLQVWLVNWPVLSGKERAALFKQFDITTKQYQKLEQILKFAKSINRQKVLCSQLKYNSAYKEHKTSWLYKKTCLM